MMIHDYALLCVKQPCLICFSSLIFYIYYIIFFRKSQISFCLPQWRNRLLPEITKRFSSFPSLIFYIYYSILLKESQIFLCIRIAGWSIAASHIFTTIRIFLPLFAYFSPYPNFTRLLPAFALHASQPSFTHPPPGSPWRYLRTTCTYYIYVLSADGELAALRAGSQFWAAPRVAALFYYVIGYIYYYIYYYVCYYGQWVRCALPVYYYINNYIYNYYYMYIYYL